MNPDGLGWLKDPTGNRRYWPVKVGQAKIERIRDEAQQLWAEALHRYQAGEHWWLEDQVVITEAKDAQMERTEEDVWAPAIDKRINGETRILIRDILESLEIPNARQGSPELRRVAGHLRKRGWIPNPKTTRHGGKLGKYWIAPDGRELFDDPAPEPPSTPPPAQPARPPAHAFAGDDDPGPQERD